MRKRRSNTIKGYKHKNNRRSTGCSKENELDERKSTQKESSQDSSSSPMTGDGSFNQSDAGGRKVDKVMIQHLLGC